MPADAPTHYDVLGLTPEASTDEIKAAVRKGQRAHHPDVAGDDPSHHEAYLAIMAAGEVLLDERARADYDASLNAAPHKGPPPQAQSHDAGDESEQSEPLVANVAPSEGPIRVVNSYPDLRIVAGIGAVALLISVWLAEVPWQPTLLAGVVVALIGSLWGYLDYRGPQQQGRPPRVRSRFAWSTLVAGVVMSVVSIASLACDVWMRTQHHSTAMKNLSRLPLVVISLCLGWIVGQTLWQMRRDAKIMPKSSMRDSTWFGQEHGGADGAYMTRILAQVCGSNVRVFQLQHPVFTHMVITGRRIIFLRYLQGPDGDYRYSGDALLVTVPGGSIHEVCRVNMPAVMSELHQEMPRRMQMDGYIVIGADRITSTDHVVSPADVAKLVASDDMSINRSVVIDALLSVARASA